MKLGEPDFMENKLTPPPPYQKKNSMRRNLAVIILLKMMFINDLDNINFIKIINLKISWGLWFYKYILKKELIFLEL